MSSASLALPSMRQAIPSKRCRSVEKISRRSCSESGCPVQAPLRRVSGSELRLGPPVLSSGICFLPRRPARLGFVTRASSIFPRRGERLCQAAKRPDGGNQPKHCQSTSLRIYDYLKANNRIARKAKVFHLERFSESCVRRELRSAGQARAPVPTRARNPLEKNFCRSSIMGEAVRLSGEGQGGPMTCNICF